AECVAIHDGKIIEVGSNENVLMHYESDSIISLKGKYVYPALMDAHAHFFGLAEHLGECNLYGAKTVYEIIQRLKAFHQKNSERRWLLGRGWDQNLFDDKKFPTKEALDSVFKDIPVCLRRIDGHAIWVNSKAIEESGINKHQQVKGGEILTDDDGNYTGIFIDNATSLIEKHIPSFSTVEWIKLLMKADSICQKNQLKYIHEAGLNFWQIKLLDSLIEKGIIKTKIYAMALPEKENIDYFEKHGKIDKENFKVKAIKIYADGALGSRGALLKNKYNDHNSYGLNLINPDSLKRLLDFCYKKGIQVCTHAIGDSANKLVLQSYAQFLEKKNDRRWRIEHVQVIDSSDWWYFKEYKILPSVQPTHAVSDKNWAMARLGKKRIRWSYAYQSLWQQNRMLALGTDFPVEDVSPLKTFFAAVFRCDYDLKDTTPFYLQEKLTREQTLRGMTIDAAYAAFMEKETGSIEKGKKAEFTILDIDLMKVSKKELSTYLLKHQ
ncbi:MAG: amidohydrolase, partial [Bacteroidia bacterium]|nr:amidohydrolase [Bacteroidia bacterium]